MKHFLRIVATANRRLDDVGGELSAARDWIFASWYPLTDIRSL